MHYDLRDKNADIDTVAVALLSLKLFHLIRNASVVSPTY